MPHLRMPRVESVISTLVGLAAPPIAVTLTPDLDCVTPVDAVVLGGAALLCYAATRSGSGSAGLTVRRCPEPGCDVTVRYQYVDPDEATLLDALAADHSRHPQRRAPR